MKSKVVKPLTEAPENTENKAYLFRERADGVAGFVTRERYMDGKYIARSFDEVTNGNGWSEKENNNLKDLLDELIDDGFEVFEINSLNEFMLNSMDLME